MSFKFLDTRSNVVWTIFTHLLHVFFLRSFTRVLWPFYESFRLFSNFILNALNNIHAANTGKDNQNDVRRMIIYTQSAWFWIAHHSSASISSQERAARQVGPRAPVKRDKLRFGWRGDLALAAVVAFLLGTYAVRYRCRSGRQTCRPRRFIATIVQKEMRNKSDRKEICRDWL